MLDVLFEWLEKNMAAVKAPTQIPQTEGKPVESRLYYEHFSHEFKNVPYPDVFFEGTFATLADMVGPLSCFQGVGRRFQRTNVRPTAPGRCSMCSL